MYIFFFFISIASLLSGQAVWADTLSPYRPSRDEVVQSATSCIESGKPLSEKYVCPVGNFSNGDNASLSRERIECDIQMSLAFYAIDVESKQWTKKLQTSRETNFNIWNEEIQNTLYSDKENFSDKYSAVCQFTNWTIGENASIGCAKTTDVFPETQCKGIAEKKIQTLHIIGNILASKGISKGYQNDKDRFLDATKTKYNKILDKWNAYLRIVQRAVTGTNTLVKDTVK